MVPSLGFFFLCLRWFFGFCRPGLYEVIQNIHLSRAILQAPWLSLDSGWELSCTASGPHLQGSLGSTGPRPMPPHYSRDLGPGPVVGSGLLPRFPPPACSRPVRGVDLGLLFAFFSRGLPAPALHCSSLCALRLFVSKRMVPSLSLVALKATRGAGGESCAFSLPLFLLLLLYSPNTGYVDPKNGRGADSNFLHNTRCTVPLSACTGFMLRT